MIRKEPYIVAVDGPAGSGKSSLCARVAEELHWSYVNTGILYRAIAFLALRNKVATSNEEELLPIVDAFTANFSWNPNSQRLCFDGEDITDELLTREVSAMASYIASSAKLREELLPVQRKLALLSSRGSILDGRDIGTVVFPNADLKIFLSASIEKRAHRRIRQLKDAGKAAGNLETIIQEIAERDAQDSSRAVAPLKRAEDAIDFDNSSLSFGEAATLLCGIIKEKLKL